MDVEARMKEEKSRRLYKLRSICLKCQQCSLYSPDTKMVFGEGSMDALIMFIGEGPGREEDLTGRPFVGRSGKLLRKMIQAIKLDPASDCFIANIVKHRPPQNRTPERAEVDQCVKFLKKQIEIIEPALLVLLGKTAVRGLFPDYAEMAIHDLRSKSKGHPGLVYEDVRALVTFHPSALLRSPTWHSAAIEDFRYIETEYQSLKSDKEVSRMVMAGELEAEITPF